MCIAVPIPCPVYSDQPVLPGRAGRPLHRVRDVTDPVPGPGLGDARPQRRLARVEQRLIRLVDLAYPHRDGRVAVPAVDDRAAVDRDDVARVEAAVPGGDAVHDLLVHRRADRGRIAVVAEEGRDRARRSDLALGNRVEVGGGDPRPHRLGEDPQRMRDHQASLAHAGDLPRGLDLNRTIAPQPHATTPPLQRYRRRSLPGANGRRAAWDPGARSWDPGARSRRLAASHGGAWRRPGRERDSSPVQLVPNAAPAATGVARYRRRDENTFSLFRTRPLPPPGPLASQQHRPDGRRAAVADRANRKTFHHVEKIRNRYEKITGS